ncbi:MAG: hypothetical protein H3C35_13745, partial [Bacteroidetes bacterium]|nr:hypothetical protein [Bacteroidota bacterium]
VKDANGNPIFVSDQDSYCVYDDANNQLGKLGIQIHQIGYAYGLKSIQNCIFYTFKIISTRNTALSNVYFGIYADIDVGNVSGGDPEYADDKLGFDKTKNFVYFYDDGVTSEWPDGKTGYFGMALFQTPKVNGVELGLTDMHYNLYNDDKDQDTIQYGIMSSAASLYNSVDGNKYFHLGTNPNLHYDDPKTIPPAGMDLVANFGSGPYTLNPNDTLTFVMAILAGNDSADIYKTYNETKKVFLNNYEAAKPPLTPTLTGAAGNNRVTLFWDDKAEKSKDSYSGQYDFEGYRLYRSVDKGIHWKLLSEYDIINNIGLDKGLQYSYTDSTVINGIEYWYTLTSFDRGDSGVASLECGLGKVPGVPNLAVVIPHSEAIGRTPVSLDSVYHIGNGKSNYLFNVKPADLPINTANTYEVGFTYTTRYERGAPSVKAEIIVGDSAKINKNYSFQFIAPNRVNLINATTGLEFDGNPKSYSPSLGTTYTVQGISDGNFKIKLSPADTVLANRPKAGDIISVNFSVQVKRFGMDTSIVVAPRDFSSLPNFLQATYDGIIFSVKPPEVIQNIYRQGRK